MQRALLRTVAILLAQCAVVCRSQANTPSPMQNQAGNCAIAGEPSALANLLFATLPRPCWQQESRSGLTQ